MGLSTFNRNRVRRADERVRRAPTPVPTTEQNLRDEVCRLNEALTKARARISELEHEIETLTAPAPEQHSGGGRGRR